MVAILSQPQCVKGKQASNIGFITMHELNEGQG